MTIEENLTYLQKVALKGEVALALSTASHDTEIKYRIYLILKEVEDRFKPFIIDCLKGSLTFDEHIIDRIYLEILNNQVPVWLWVEEVIADIETHLSIANSGLSIIPDSKLSIDKLQERKNIIESSFMYFVRDAIILSPSAVEELLEKVLLKDNLDFLHEACFFLKSFCKEAKALAGENAEVPEELMSFTFDAKRILSFSAETAGLEKLNRKAKKKVQSRNNTTNLQGNFVIHGELDINNTITYEQLSNCISKKIAELFEEAVAPSTVERPDTAYVVKKVFTDSGITTDIRICKTEEEAVNFVKRIVQEYPDITRSCEFRVQKERVSRNGEKRRETKET